MVISGGNFKPDSLKPKEVVSLLLDDDELEKKREGLFFFQSLINTCKYLKMYLGIPISVCSAPETGREAAARGEQQGQGAQEEEGEVC